MYKEVTLMLEKKDILSGVYGLAVGDALGVPVEFMSREEIERNPVTDMRGYGSHNQPIGTWSDDTSMVLATLDAMCRGLNYNVVMDNFTRWFKNADYTAGGEVFDVGNTTCNAIFNYSVGEDISRCGASDINSNGNGSLMRMLPMVYYILERYGEKPTVNALNEIYRLSGLTHNHIISKVCCVYYVYIGISILTKKSTDTLQECIINGLDAVIEYYYPNGELPFWDDLTGLVETGRLSSVMDLPIEQIKSSGYVVDSLEASIWSLYNTSSYEEAVLTAVNLGLDTDTIGAIVGSLAGIYYGVENIPTKWVKVLRNKGLIDNICGRFYEQIK
jgi:ADP-ribosylglycohydrolase